MGLLDSNDVDFIRECLDDIADDVERPIAYKRYTGISAVAPADPVMGIPDTYVYSDSDTTATVRDLTLEEIQKSGGVYVLGDVEFKIRQTALAEPPSHSDRIVYAGYTFKPKSIGHSFLGGLIIWNIRAGKQ